MTDPSYRLRSPEDSRAYTEPPRLPGTDADDDLYFYGWRWKRSAEGQLRQIPLTYQDLLDPQEDDCVSEDSIHRIVTEMVSGILTLRYEDEPKMAIWSDLKIKIKIPDVTTGPSPDVCVVEGVRDRGRRRRSFDPKEEPGKIRLAVEVVSKNSLKKDYKDILPIYTALGLKEYVAIQAQGLYLDGKFKLTGWHRDSKTRQLVEMVPDADGCLLLETVGLRFGTGPGGNGFVIRDAATGEILRAPVAEVRRQKELAEQAKMQAEQATERAEKAEAEVERLRAELRKSQAKPDL